LLSEVLQVIAGAWTDLRQFSILERIYFWEELKTATKAGTLRA
jgi:hypothetical protein